MPIKSILMTLIIQFSGYTVEGGVNWGEKINFLDKG
jgi:hypothetical protein